MRALSGWELDLFDWLLKSIAIPLLVWTAAKVRSISRMIADDHRKISALWREHGYNDWNGVERRKEGR